jgi:hypothetical protein
MFFSRGWIITKDMRGPSSTLFYLSIQQACHDYGGLTLEHRDLLSRPAE